MPFKVGFNTNDLTREMRHGNAGHNNHIQNNSNYMFAVIKL